MDRYRSLVLIPILVLSFFGAACATKPATGQHQFSLMSEDQELQIGQQQDIEVRRQMGVYADPATQQYVSIKAATLAIMNTHAIADEPRPGERLKVVV
jgi:predicted Zn-dependent protease